MSYLRFLVRLYLFNADTYSLWQTYTTNIVSGISNYLAFISFNILHIETYFKQNM